MKQYDLRISRGHLIIELEDGLYIIDTGSPFSIGLGESIQIADNNYSSNAIMREFVNLPNMKEFIGVELSGLIGCDILMDFCCIFDLKNLKLRLSKDKFVDKEENFIITELKNFQNTPYINIKIGGKNVNSFIDTGATISYFRKTFLRNCTSIRNEMDTHPLIGSFETNIFNYQIQIESQDFAIEVGTLPQKLDSMFDMIDADAVIGYELIKEKITAFDFIDNN